MDFSIRQHRKTPKKILANTIFHCGTLSWSKHSHFPKVFMSLLSLLPFPNPSSWPRLSSACNIRWERFFCPLGLFASILKQSVSGKQTNTRRRGYVHIYSWIRLFYSRNECNIIKQLSSDYKIKLKKYKSKPIWGKFKLLFQNSHYVRDRGNPKLVLCENPEE